ncbi:LysR family transcriptional regulator [Scandinavium goeteborgense]|uniref:DNA-binding transcriptional LysR family regulator n=1 Tax=Scandinavium goeteborgense TaxID=1851514 RepID=A0A4R6DPU1_SCAGO|nr:LysR family transcriptional regulator [Scandinavium goeteborgense]TDN47021.1 DNA-binding transcriptional LysR family regulator [Scandinavium goeteborgense]
MHTISLQKLKIINEVIECENAMKAASRLKISPSTISYTIKSLKEKLGTDIFVRTPSGLKPNDTALVLQERYRELIALNTSRKEYFIATYSLIELLLTESIQFRNDETLFHFITMDTSEDERLRKLKQREVDIDIGGKLPDDLAIISKKYLQSDMKILVSENHPTISNAFTIDDWLNNTHLRWRRDLGSITAMVNGMNMSNELMFNRDISWESPNLLTMAYLCARGDSIMLVPEVFVASLKKILPLKALTLPDKLEMKFECYIHHHRSLKVELKDIDLKFM